MTQEQPAWFKRRYLVHARLPLETPGWLTPRRITLAAIAVATAAMAVPSVYWVDLVRGAMREIAANMLTMTVCTVVPALLVTWYAFQNPARSIRRFLIFGTLAGALDAGLSLMLVEGRNGSSPAQMVGLFFLGTLFGGVVGAPLGFAYGAGYAVATHPLRDRTVPTHDRVDRTALWVGAWSLAISAIAALLARTVPFYRLWIAPAALGTILVALSAIRIVLRKRFVSRVRSGLVPDWGIVPYPGGCDDQVLALEQGGPESVDGLLVRFEPRQLGPYRDAPTGVALARVRLHAPPASKLDRARVFAWRAMKRGALALGMTAGKLAVAGLMITIALVLVAGVLTVAAQVLRPLDSSW